MIPRLFRKDGRAAQGSAGPGPSASTGEAPRRDDRSGRTRPWSTRGKGIGAGLLMFAFGALFATVVELDNPMSFAQSPRPRPAGPQAPSPSPAPPAAAQPAAPAGAAQADPPFLAHTRQAGIKTCGTVYPALGQLLTEGSQFMVQSSWNRTAPDAHSVLALVGMTYGASPAAGVVFASPSGTRCDGNLVRVVPFAEDCNAAATKLPQGSTPAANLAGVAVYNLPAAGGQAMLLAAGTGCVALSVLRVERAAD